MLDARFPPYFKNHLNRTESFNPKRIQGHLFISFFVQTPTTNFTDTNVNNFIEEFDMFLIGLLFFSFIISQNK